jgi:hypothetical protein
MQNSHSFDRPNCPVSSQRSEFNASAAPAQNDDAGLLALQAQFDELVGDLLVVQARDMDLAGIDAGTTMNHAEAILARLYPIEQAIMQTRALTIAGLGVKACHAAYVMSEYWEAPIEQLDWDAQTIRLLIEAVCNFTGTPLPFSERYE